jgi:hypothetical protein
MARQIEPREDCGEVRRTELTGSTRSLAPRRQANEIAPRGIIVLALGHRGYCRASRARSQPRASGISQAAGVADAGGYSRVVETVEQRDCELARCAQVSFRNRFIQGQLAFALQDRTDQLESW